MAAWEFWIDVGGTFTDCFARGHDGRLTHYKLLSSGVIKGSVAAGSSRDAIRRSGPVQRSGRLLDRLSTAAARRTRPADSANRPSRASIAKPELCNWRIGLVADPQPGQGYELSSGLEAPIVAIRYLLGLPLGEPIPPVAVRLGTTRGTNALITRRGAKTALVTTRGFGDVLQIGYQNRPAAVRPGDPQAAAAVRRRRRNRRADRRRRARCSSRPMPRKSAEQLAALRQQGIESLAICLLHAFVRPRPRTARRADRRARSGFDEISVSSQRRAAGQDRLARRHDGDGRLSESRSCGATSARCATSCPAARCGS